MMINLPSGAMGVALKLKGPLKSSQADMAGAMLDWSRWLSVSLVWVRSLSHRNFWGTW